MQDLKNFEKGIHLGHFNSSLDTKRIELEFRTLQKMCFHKDHVQNLFTSFDVQFHKINRYKDILPFLHNRVILKENSILPIPPPQNGDEEDINDGGRRAKMIDKLIDTNDSDPSLLTYFNASHINSMVKKTRDLGSSYIASSSPGLKTSNSRFNDDEPEVT